MRQIDCTDLRVILCLRFNQSAPPESVSKFKSALITCPQTLHVVESIGEFDFMIEIAPRDMSSYNDWRQDKASDMLGLVERCETSFVCSRLIRRLEDDPDVWVPSGDGHKRLSAAQIEKVRADGDYVRIHVSGQSWLLHATMQSLTDRLGSDHFVQLHRSLIVRKNFVDRFDRVGRHWEAALRDGTVERVASSHVAEVLRMTHPPTFQQGSPNRKAVVDYRAKPHRKGRAAPLGKWH